MIVSPKESAKKGQDKVTATFSNVSSKTI